MINEASSSYFQVEVEFVTAAPETRIKRATPVRADEADTIIFFT